MDEHRAQSRDAPARSRRGPRSRGRGRWPFMTFDIEDAGEREACRVAQRLAVLLLQAMATDGCSMRQLARDSGVDVTTVKSVLEGTYGPRLDTAVRLMVARGLPLSLLTTVDLDTRAASSITLPEQAQPTEVSAKADGG